MDHQPLIQAFAQVDEQIIDLERILNERKSLPLQATVEHAMTLTKQLIIAYIVDVGVKEVPDISGDLLDVFKVLVKSDPSWNTIRDNCRELVYYHNCITMDRMDALPENPEKMAVRTLRHLYLFMKTRCMREERLEMA
ncbi:hypothetical protein CAP31_06490 [Sulfuriferula sp. AH1]|uniref:hypothetical protein n=1 Tax=Sulfuriferula sp. AH1 TaxID=1985873 RepID=UPI000B3B91B5|nr:hypothetical protein [Sulfuriferula sp. AH1]ARU31363.1 hypothetical protein CAP31_06490 [Sulfuriferula sp. AH1]